MPYVRVRFEFLTGFVSALRHLLKSPLSITGPDRSIAQLGLTIAKVFCDLAPCILVMGSTNNH